MYNVGIQLVYQCKGEVMEANGRGDVHGGDKGARTEQC